MLRETLAENGILEALEALGYDYEKIFGGLSQELEGSYERYTWRKVPCMQEGIRLQYVIHAVPPKEQWGEKPWEEWFFRDEEAHHHVLFCEERDFCDCTVFLSEEDKEHPQEVCGRTWYYYQDPSSVPYLRQQR